MSLRVVQWSKAMKTGHKDIDKQHQDLFIKFDEFIVATMNDCAADRLKSLLDFLLKYSEEHFSFEEEHYRRKNYPKLVEHRTEHAAFLQSLRQIRRTYHNEKGKIEPQKLNELLGDWLRSHIRESGMEAFEWIETNPSEFYHKPTKLQKRQAAS